MTVYIYSTLTCDNAYAEYEPLSHDRAPVSVVRRTILIKGGHGIANKYVQTPRGVMTEVTDEEFQTLQKNEHFNQHVNNGFITHELKAGVDAEKVADRLVDRDASAPMLNSEFEEVKDENGQTKKIYKPKGKKA